MVAIAAMPFGAISRKPFAAVVDERPGTPGPTVTFAMPADDLGVAGVRELLEHKIAHSNVWPRGQRGIGRINQQIRSRSETDLRHRIANLNLLFDTKRWFD